MIHFLPEFLTTLLILVLAELAYLRIALNFRIIDRPNERSSHKVPVIRGGGIIFMLSAILFFLWSGFKYPYFLGAVLLSGGISFLDDIRPVNNIVKFCAHLFSAALLLQETKLSILASPLLLAVICIMVIAIINAYNFMDGINGLTGLYSIAVILPLCLTERNGDLQSLQIFILLGLLVFNFFNTRKRPKCFGGDVGSISLAIFIVFFIMVRILETNDIIYIGLLLLYGIDTVFTVSQRIYNRENIFKPHRKHLYQYLANERKIPHLQVSFSYALVQLLINLAIVYNFIHYYAIIFITILISSAYALFKSRLNKITVS